MHPEPVGAAAPVRSPVYDPPNSIVQTSSVPSPVINREKSPGGPEDPEIPNGDIAAKTQSAATIGDIPSNALIGGDA